MMVQYPYQTPQYSRFPCTGATPLPNLSRQQVSLYRCYTPAKPLTTVGSLVRACSPATHRTCPAAAQEGAHRCGSSEWNNSTVEEEPIGAVRPKQRRTTASRQHTMVSSSWGSGHALQWRHAKLPNKEVIGKCKTKCTIIQDGMAVRGSASSTGQKVTQLKLLHTWLGCAGVQEQKGGLMVLEWKW